ncbi:MAG: 4Fe-4S dicluster domain-containing protein [Bacteroidales bacterium]
MVQFNFGIKPSRIIDYDNTDTRIFNFVIENESSFNACISCGCCTASCSASNILDLNIRKISLLLRRGITLELEKEINKCMLCGKCTLVCPRGVNTRNVILNIKKAFIKISENEL